MGGKHSAGKGDTYRKVDYGLWSKNWDAIFQKKTKKKSVKLAPKRKP
jgi:hypothetical protein